MNKIKVGVCFALCSLAAPSMAQYLWQEEDGTEKIDLREDIQYGVLIECLIVSCETSRKRKARKMIVWYLASFFVFKLPCGFCGRLLVFLMCF